MFIGVLLVCALVRFIRVVWAGLLVCFGWFECVWVEVVWVGRLGLVGLRF